LSLLDTRDYYKPFDHPWMFDYYSQQNQMHWFPEDVPLHNDVTDCQTMTDEEQERKGGGGGKRGGGLGVCLRPGRQPAAICRM